MDIQSVAIGMNSTVDADKHIILLDFDEVTIDDVRESVAELQEFWNLADADIFKTKNGFHAYFWYDHVPYDRLKMIINYARHVDPMFKYISKYYDRKTIRIAGKYKEKDIFFEETIKGVRFPTKIERDIGNLKKNERKILENSL